MSKKDNKAKYIKKNMRVPFLVCYLGDLEVREGGVVEGEKSEKVE